jgi:hypothetical protein
MTTLWQDARYSLRILIKYPWFTCVAVIALALEIAANPAIFSVINGILIRSLPFPDSRRLVWITNQEKGGPSIVTGRIFTFRDLRRYSRLFTDMAASNAFFQYFGYNLTGRGDLERLSGVDVSETFFGKLRGEAGFGADVSSGRKWARWPARCRSFRMASGRLGSEPGRKSSASRSS